MQTITFPRLVIVLNVLLKHILIQPNQFHVYFTTYVSDGASLTFLIYFLDYVLFLINLRNSQKYNPHRNES